MKIRTVAVIVTTVIATLAAGAQTVPCVNDAPNPYEMVSGWAQLSRPIGEGNSISVDTKDNVWVVDRCDASCATSKLAPIWNLSPNGKVLKNFGSESFLGPHGLWVDKAGNLWVADREIKDGRGMTVTKLSPDGKVLLVLGTPGEKGKGLDHFDSPSAVAIAPNGDIFVADGHRTGAEGQPQAFGNARMMKFDKNGKFIKTFGHLSSSPGGIMQPHGLA